MQSMYAMQYEKIRLSTKFADIVINPDVSRIGAFGFHRGEEAILPKLQEKIWLSQ